MATKTDKQIDEQINEHLDEAIADATETSLTVVETPESKVPKPLRQTLQEVAEYAIKKLEAESEQVHISRNSQVEAINVRTNAAVQGLERNIRQLEAEISKIHASAESSRRVIETEAENRLMSIYNLIDAQKSVLAAV